MSKKIEKKEIKENLKKKREETKKKTEKTINEYKEFALKGNVLDMAIGVVIGTAFTSIVNTIVSSIITPLLGMLTNHVDLSSLFITLHGPKMNTLAEAKAAGALVLSYGELLNSILYFFIVSFTLFVVVKFIKRGKKKEEKVKEETTKACPYCLSMIPIKATRCSHCTSILDEKEKSKNINKSKNK